MANLKGVAEQASVLSAGQTLEITLESRPDPLELLNLKYYLENQHPTLSYSITIVDKKLTIEVYPRSP